MIETRRLIKRVHTTEGLLTILKGIDLRITEGEVVAIVGASGSGKSTLLGLMAGLDGATSGDVLLGGKNFSAMDEEQRAMLRGQLVGFVFQSFQLLPSLTALENVMLPIELKGDSSAREKAQHLLSRVGLQKRCHIAHQCDEKLARVDAFRHGHGIGCVKNYQVDIGRIVQLAPAMLAHGQHNQSGLGGMRQFSVCDRFPHQPIK